MTPPIDDAQLLVAILAAEKGFGAAAGGGAVCTFTKAGIPVPGIKYAEGQWAALREVAQLALTSGVGFAEAAAATSSAWVDSLKQLTASGAGPDWIAYRNGGVDSLAELSKSADTPH